MKELRIYSFLYRGEHLNQIKEWFDASRCLYNQALYEEMKYYKSNDRWLLYGTELDNLMKDLPALVGTYNPNGISSYRRLPAQVAQSCLQNLSNNIVSYIRASSDRKNHPKKYKGKPKPPKYLTEKEHFLSFSTINKKKLNVGLLHLPCTNGCCIEIPQFEKYKDRLKKAKMFRIIPGCDHAKVEIAYEVDIPELLPSNEGNFMSIDLGVNNFATCVIGDGYSMIIDGKEMKSINRLYNKKLAKKRAKIDICKPKKKFDKNGNIITFKQTSKSIKKDANKRKNRVKQFIHGATNEIINKAKEHNVNTMIVGYNPGIKHKISLKKKTNQIIVYMPWWMFIKVLRYKCREVGIRIVVVEESYTSRCDALILESVGPQEVYVRKRIKRGLYQSEKSIHDKRGVLINADVNGAINIARKCIDDAHVMKQVLELVGSGVGFTPVRYRILSKRRKSHSSKERVASEGYYL